MTTRFPATVVALLLASLLTPTALACLWDYDTLQMERLRFPGVLEIITGKFVRHSKAYYEWRLVDRTKKLETSPGDAALIDDLAVAHDKLGQQEKGIKLLEESLQRNPDRYETLANLGTLLFHTGRIEESKAFIERAITINPDAHFGRERYQLLLTDYLLHSEQEASGVMSSDERHTHGRVVGFARYLLIQKYGDDKALEYGLGGTDSERGERKEEIRKAGKGVLGMMHFANYQSPVLLEALGDLLMTGEMDENGTQLAARAYLRAAAGSSDKEIADNYRKMARDVLSTHEGIAAHHREADGDYLVKVDQKLARELADAKNWFANIEKNEQRWIDEERNVDLEFAAIYYDSLDETIAAATKQVVSEPKERRAIYVPPVPKGLMVTFWSFVALIVVGTGAAMRYWILRRRRAVPTTEQITKAF
jgi:tetratricopeptide (TPR) repeat protein